MKRTFIGAALAFTFALTGPGSDDAANPLPPANVAPDGVAEQQPSTDAADQEHGRPGEGGAQELELVKRYRDDAQRFADRWPRMASILRKLVKSYESEARRNEESAERFRRGLKR